MSNGFIVTTEDDGAHCLRGYFVIDWNGGEHTKYY